jgi:hypothetical protein
MIEYLSLISPLAYRLSIISSSFLRLDLRDYRPWASSLGRCATVPIVFVVVGIEKNRTLTSADQFHWCGPPSSRGTNHLFTGWILLGIRDATTISEVMPNETTVL